MLDNAASVLQSNGWSVSTGPLPIAHAGFWGSGWDDVADACRRFHYPASSNAGPHELLILPTTFVGLDSVLDLDTAQFTKVTDNIYCPSAHLLAKTIVTVAIRCPSKISQLAFLMRAWISYFFKYLGFHLNSLDDAECEVKEYWRKLGEQCLLKA